MHTCIMVPVCYVMVPPSENGMPWQESACTFQSERWPQDFNATGDWSHHRAAQSWDQSDGLAAPTGVWLKQVVPPTRQTPSPKGSASPQQQTKPKKASALASRRDKNNASTSDSTVILRNLPLETTRDSLLDLLDREGFSGGYDFLHLPMDFQTKAGLGYALLNLVSHKVALQVHQYFNGFRNWPYASDNVCEVAWNSPQQGLETHIERYRNSPLMHPSVPETYRPVVLVDGVRAQFPPPTHRIRPPRIRHQKPTSEQKAYA